MLNARERRYYFVASQPSPTAPEPREMLGLFAQIYAVEKEAREAGLLPPARLELRQARSRPLMETLKRRASEIHKAALPSSKIGEACAYTLSQWERLEQFLNDGILEADNNLCENGMRPIALDRNYAEIRIMRSTAAELVMSGLDCSIDGRLRKGGVCAISQWVFAKHHDSKTIPSPLRSTPHGRQPSGHNPGAVRYRFAGTRLCGVDSPVLRASHRTFLPLAWWTSTRSTMRSTSV